MQKRFLSLLATVTMLAAVQGCSGDPYQRVSATPASPALAKSALDLAKPAADAARVIAFAGGSTDSKGYHPSAMSVALFVNDIQIGVINPNEAMVFDLRPGEYRFNWRFLVPLGLFNKAETTAFVFQGGTTTALQAGTEGYSLVVREGFAPRQIIGGGGAGQQRIQPDIEITRPATCPPSLCLPLN